MHALRSGLGLVAYAAKVGKAVTTMQSRWEAAAVAERVITDISNNDLQERWSALAAIHPAKEWLWSALVTQLLAEGWTVDVTRRRIKPFQKLNAPPDWVDLLKPSAGPVGRY
jgi:hypothetical protein